MNLLKVCIVAHNNEETIMRCLESLYRQDIDFDIIIFDNGSSDATISLIEAFKHDIVLLKNYNNIGFGKAINQISTFVSDGIMLILNPDVVIPDNTLKSCLKYYVDDIDAGILSIPLKDYRNKIRTAGVVGTIDRYKDCFKNYDKLSDAYNCLYVSGAFMLIYTNYFKMIGGFDEQFFMYYEDFDLCLKMKEFGKSVKILKKYDKEIFAIHKFQGSMIDMIFRMKLIEESKEKFYQKWKS